MHIGLIGGIGPAATAYYYRGLIRAAAHAGHALELTIAHAQLTGLVSDMAAAEPDRSAQAFAKLGKRLQAAGAQRLAVTSMAGHFCINELSAISPLPVINAIPVATAELKRLGHRRIGLLGTQLVMNSRLYGALDNFEVVVPEGTDAVRAGATYMEMARAGVADAAQRDALFSFGRELCTHSDAEIVLLAGTDLFLAFEGFDCGFPVIDSADIHIAAIFAEACSD